MAKKKTRILWLSTTKDGYTYYLDDEEPEWNKYCDDWDSEGLFEFCTKQFLQLCPALKLRKNTKCKLRLTQLKNGIKLEKVK